MKILRLAAQHVRHEWAVRPRSTVLYVAVIPAALVSIGAGPTGDWSLAITLAIMFYLGWRAQSVWLLAGKVQMVVREWSCVQEGCDYRQRVDYVPAGRAAFARHLREAHGIEATPEDFRRA